MKTQIILNPHLNPASRTQFLLFFSFTIQFSATVIFKLCLNFHPFFNFFKIFVSNFRLETLGASEISLEIAPRKFRRSSAATTFFYY